MEPTANPVVTIPKQFKNITELYRSCRFDEADAQLQKFDKLPHQKLAVQAQLAFFKWDFDSAVELILGYFGHLNEWYSGNAQDDTILMLVFSLLNCSAGVKENVIGRLTEIHDSHIGNERYIKRIPEIIEMANCEADSLEKYAYNRYTAPADPKPLSEIIEIYKESNKKDCAKIKGDILTNEKAVVGILRLIADMGEPSDYAELYNKVRKSHYLMMHEAMRAARIYRFLGRYDDARQAILDHVRYQWQCIEWTEVMPVSALIGFDCFDLYTKELFEEIYNTPKGVSEETVMSCEKLKYSHNFDELFAQKEFSGFELNRVKIAKLSVISGKLIVCDPLMWLSDDSKPFAQKVPKGEYDVIAQIAVKDEVSPVITAVMVRFSDAPAVTYRNAVYGDEAQYEIDKLADDDYIGFSISAGLCTIIDEKVSKEYIKLRDKLEKKNNKDIYSCCLAELFAESAEKSPKFQRECGDYIDFVIPDTEHHIPMFASGPGDGYYPVYFGYDNKGKVCSIVVEFLSTY